MGDFILKQRMIVDIVLLPFDLFSINYEEKCQRAVKNLA